MKNKCDLDYELREQFTETCVNCWLETNVAFDLARFEKSVNELWNIKYSFLVDKSEFNLIRDEVLDNKEIVIDWLY